MNPELLQAHADLIRESGVLGRSALRLRLFDLLVNSSLRRKTLSEAEIATRIFRRTSEGRGRDAVVRVYMYRLRQRLDDYYSDAEGREGERLAIPQGEYRLTLVPSRRVSRMVCPHCSKVIRTVRRRSHQTKSAIVID